MRASLRNRYLLVYVFFCWIRFSNWSLLLRYIPRMSLIHVCLLVHCNIGRCYITNRFRKTVEKRSALKWQQIPCNIRCSDHTFIIYSICVHGLMSTDPGYMLNNVSTFDLSGRRCICFWLLLSNQCKYYILFQNTSFKDIYVRASAAAAATDWDTNSSVS